MKINQFQPLITLFATAIALFLFHKFLFYFIAPSNLESSFTHSLFKIYTFFTILSFTILLVLIKISQKSMTNVGMIFIILTTFKMGIAFMFLKPILNSSSEFVSIEKINFLIIFLLFLTTETLLTIQLINKKQ